MNALVFQSATLNPVRQNDGQIWVTASDLAKALDYKQADSITRIFNRNSDEFTENMTQVIDISQTVKLTASNLVNKVRIFSLRGAHLIAMFARTPVAKEFRKWVLDVIEKKESKPKKQIDMSMYVSKDVHNNLALKYHCMFRQYDDMIDDLRDQVSRMENKCRRYNFKMHITAIPIDVAAKQFHATESHLKRLLVQEGILEERDPYIEINKKVLTLTKRGQQLELVFLKSDIVNGDVQDIIMVTEDGLSYLSGMLDK